MLDLSRCTKQTANICLDKMNRHDTVSPVKWGQAPGNDRVPKPLPRAAHPIYHLTNAGQTSWHGFARRVFELAGVAGEIVPVTSAEFGARARRPPYSVLAHTNLAALGENDLRPWDAALAAYLAERASSVYKGLTPLSAQESSATDRARRIVRNPHDEFSVYSLGRLKEAIAWPLIKSH